MNVLKTQSGYGFFSCCERRLHDIIQYVNKNKKIPDRVDSTEQFEWYKDHMEQDASHVFFQSEDIVELSSKVSKRYVHYPDNFQNVEPEKLPLTNLKPYIEKYFTVSEEIVSIETDIMDQYNVSCENTCVLLYRGNDKACEQGEYDISDYIRKAEEIITKDNNIKLLIQSDQTEFIEKMLETFPDRCVVFTDHIRHMTNRIDSVDWVYGDRVAFTKNYLAITSIMSKCKHIVCQPGNCSLWVILYRGHIDNVFQFDYTSSTIPHEIKQCVNYRTLQRANRAHEIEINITASDIDKINNFNLKNYDCE